MHSERHQRRAPSAHTYPAAVHVRVLHGGAAGGVGVHLDAPVAQGPPPAEAAVGQQVEPRTGQPPHKQRGRLVPPGPLLLLPNASDVHIGVLLVQDGVQVVLLRRGHAGAGHRLHRGDLRRQEPFPDVLLAALVHHQRVVAVQAALKGVVQKAQLHLLQRQGNVGKLRRVARVSDGVGGRVGMRVCWGGGGKEGWMRGRMGGRASWRAGG